MVLTDTPRPPRATGICGAQALGLGFVAHGLQQIEADILVPTITCRIAFKWDHMGVDEGAVTTAQRVNIGRQAKVHSQIIPQFWIKELPIGHHR